MAPEAIPIVSYLRKTGNSRTGLHLRGHPEGMRMLHQKHNRRVGSRDSMSPSERSHGILQRRTQGGPCVWSDPVVVGLERVLAGLCVLLLVGLMALAVGFLSGGIEWDSPVMKSRHANVSEAEAQRHAVMRVASSSSPAVIRFDASQLNDEGLSGAAKGLRALSYEFCIPAGEAHVEEVESIDSTIAIQRSSPGRIGCREAEYLAIGHTHQPDFREVLIRLSHLPYVDRIEEVHFE